MRIDQWSATVTIDGVPTGVWDKADGGDTTSENVKHRKGGMGGEVSLGGLATTDDLTITRLYERERDHALCQSLQAGRVGKARVTVSKQPLDPDGIAWGDPTVHTGVLTGVQPPKPDAGTSEAAVWSIVVSVDGPA